MFELSDYLLVCSSRRYVRHSEMQPPRRASAGSGARYTTPAPMTFPQASTERMHLVVVRIWSTDATDSRTVSCTLSARGAILLSVVLLCILSTSSKSFRDVYFDGQIRLFKI